MNAKVAGHAGAVEVDLDNFSAVSPNPHTSTSFGSPQFGLGIVRAPMRIDILMNGHPQRNAVLSFRGRA
ncbi:MAG: hypothetical protein Q8N44_18675 [Rubrivivax sp.]|nr:hypothetical protein [Rubrivivax sp.]MDP3085696.1 hypothetical protein [Rubrivivax sp.]